MNNEITGKQGITCFPLFCYGWRKRRGKWGKIRREMFLLDLNAIVGYNVP